MDRRDSDDVVRLGELLGQTYEALAGEESTAPAESRGGDRRRSPAAGSKGASPASPEQMVARVWPDVVGPEVAANTRPVQLRRQRLVVSASSSAWAQTLQFMGPSIAARLNERLGTAAVDEIVFRHAGWEEQPRRSAGSDGPCSAPAGAGAAAGAAGGGPGLTPSDDTDEGLTAEQRAALADVERLDLDPALRTRVLRAMRAAFVRGQQDSVR